MRKLVPHFPLRLLFLYSFIVVVWAKKEKKKREEKKRNRRTFFILLNLVIKRRPVVSALGRREVWAHITSETSAGF